MASNVERVVNILRKTTELTANFPDSGQYDRGAFLFVISQ